ncbi:MAG: D-2-hydroxyacid dehydrogenase [Clostridia bacterium]|nr:D-2-hydroxyacid dehydrogenase [Clostridia bacterium]
MNIVITDAQTVTNGDLDLSVFSRYGTVRTYPLTSYEETPERIRDAEAVLLNKTVLDAAVLSGAPRLKYIGLFATGYNVVDVDYCREHGITVCNAGSYSTDAVAQTVFAYLLSRFSQVDRYTRFVTGGGWVASPTFSPFVFPTAELAGKTIGIIGYGTIGKNVAKIACAFRMRVLACPHRMPEQKTDGIAEFVPFRELLAQSDVVTCHCPLTGETRGMFDAAAFGAMKQGAFFINTSRGGVLDEKALRDALDSEHLSGAGVDVLNHEPMEPGNVLLGAPNLLITPHVAWAPLETRIRLLEIVEANLRNYLAGSPTNVIV